MPVHFCLKSKNSLFFDKKIKRLNFINYNVESFFLSACPLFCRPLFCTLFCNSRIPLACVYPLFNIIGLTQNSEHPHGLGLLTLSRLAFRSKRLLTIATRDSLSGDLYMKYKAKNINTNGNQHIEKRIANPPSKVC